MLAVEISPLIRIDLDDGPTVVTNVGGATTYRGRPTARPFHLDYTFNFSQHDGRPQIEAVTANPTK